jgi:hypothetical protein
MVKSSEVKAQGSPTSYLFPQSPAGIRQRGETQVAVQSSYRLLRCNRYRSMLNGGTPCF